MFEIGFWELVMVGVVALIVVGPERLPGLARTAGLWLGKARRLFAEVKAEVDRELHLEELKQSLRQQAELNPMKDLSEQINAIRQDLQAEIDNPGPISSQRPVSPSAPPPTEQSGSEPASSPSPSGPVQLQKLDSTMPFPMPASVAAAPPAKPGHAAPATPPQSPQPPTAN